MKKCLTIAASLLLVATALVAAESGQSSEPQRISVGERQMSKVDRCRVQEQRAKAAEEKGANQEPKLVKETEDGQVLEGRAWSSIVSSHEDAYHNPFLVSFGGESVTLEDGSVWFVKTKHRYKTLDWMTSDIIIITQNSSLFSSYEYRLVNLNTGASVDVNLSLGPHYNGEYTHWIVAIDYVTQDLILDDGSVWHVSTLDSGVFSNWLPNDTVIMGINDGWISRKPNILINVTMDNYACAECLN